MKKLIDLFNKKYGSVYGIIDDSIDNEDVYKVYKMIKSLCGNDQEIMEILNKIELPSPRTAKESIEKININVSGGLSKEYVDEHDDNLINIIYGGLPLKLNITQEELESMINLEDNTYTILSSISPDLIKSVVNGDDWYSTLILNNDFAFSIKGTGSIISSITCIEGSNSINMQYTNSVYRNDLPFIDVSDFALCVITSPDGVESVAFAKGVPKRYNMATKKYVDDKTEILPVKNNYIIFEDAVPHLMEDIASTYSNNSGGFEYYIFDSLQNEDMIISAVKYNLNVTFNDGTNDRTMDLIIENSLKGGAFCEKDGFAVQVSYSEAYHAIEMILVNANNHTQYSILKATLSCDAYSNLLQNHHIQSINYNKIEKVPGELDGIVNRKYFTLEGKEYYDLYDDLSIWDENKLNERLDENSGVKRNEFFKLLGKDKYTLGIKQKDSEGIGFGQHISIDNSKNVHIVADAGVDVIIKIYNSTTKELIGTLNYCEAGFYKTRIINKDYLNGVTSIFIAFTVKDSTESFYGNTYVNDLIVHYDSSFLVKEEILTKTNTKEYIPIGDYNPATKKYVDEKIASIDTTINTLPVNGSLNLTTSKFQTTTLATDTEVILPTVEGYTEIHLFFLGISGTNVSDTNVAWNSKPTIEDNKKYEFIYTYVNSEIGWLGKAVVYTV